MLLLVFSPDRNLVFVLTTEGTKIILQEPKPSASVRAYLEGLDKVTFTNKPVIKSHDIWEGFNSSVRKAVVPFYFKDQVLGALYVVCSGDLTCNAKEFEMVDLILTQSAGVMMRAVV